MSEVSVRDDVGFERTEGEATRSPRRVTAELAEQAFSLLEAARHVDPDRAVRFGEEVTRLTDMMATLQDEFGRGAQTLDQTMREGGLTRVGEDWLVSRLGSRWTEILGLSADDDAQLLARSFVEYFPQPRKPYTSTLVTICVEGVLRGLDTQEIAAEAELEVDQVNYVLRMAASKAGRAAQEQILGEVEKTRRQVRIGSRSHAAGAPARIATQKTRKRPSSKKALRIEQVAPDAAQALSTQMSAGILQMTERIELRRYLDGGGQSRLGQSEQRTIEKVRGVLAEKLTDGRDELSDDEVEFICRGFGIVLGDDEITWRDPVAMRGIENEERYRDEPRQVRGAMIRGLSKLYLDDKESQEDAA